MSGPQWPGGPPPPDPPATQPYPPPGPPPPPWTPPPPPPGLPPQGFPTVGGPEPERPRTALAFIGGLVIGIAVVGAGLWFFLAGPGAPPARRPQRPSRGHGDAARRHAGAERSGSHGGWQSRADHWWTRSRAHANIGPRVARVASTRASRRRSARSRSRCRRSAGFSRWPTCPSSSSPRRSTAVFFQEDFARENPPELIAAEEAVLIRLGMLPADADLEELSCRCTRARSPRSMTRGPASSRSSRGTTSSSGRTTGSSPPTSTTTRSRTSTSTSRGLDHRSREGDQALAELGPHRGRRVRADVRMGAAAPHAGRAPGGPGGVRLGRGPGAARQHAADPSTTARVPLPGWLPVRPGPPTGGGGWQAINAAFGARPASTEQIMHPEKYLAVRPVPPSRCPTWRRPWARDGRSVDPDDGRDGHRRMGRRRRPEPSHPGLPGAAAERRGSGRMERRPAGQPRWPGRRVGRGVADRLGRHHDADEFDWPADAAMADLPFPHEVTAASVASGLGAPSVVLIASDQDTLARLRLALPSGWATSVGRGDPQQAEGVGSASRAASTSASRAAESPGRMGRRPAGRGSRHGTSSRARSRRP